MIRGGAGVTLMPSSQHGHAYFALVLDHPKLLRDYRELFADLYAELDERVTVVRTEAFDFG
jgi:hypothetical protein